VLPPKIGEFVQQFGGAYFSTEGALWRTLALLFFKPGELTRRYRAGKRKHYVLPLRLYITVSLLALLLLRVYVPTDLEMVQGFKLDAGESPTLNVGGGSRAGLKDGKFYCEKLPPWLCQRMEAKFDLDPKSFKRDLNRLPERFINHWGTAMFLLLPLFALLHKLLYIGRGMRYTEHLVYALHVHTFWFAAAAVALLPWPWAGPAMGVVVPVYTLMAAKRAYGGGWFGTLLRAFCIALLYWTVLGIALGIVAVWAFFS
jgi:hypothetical protein